MKRLAPLLALLWWVQTPLCLLEAEASHAHATPEAAAVGEQHHHAGHGPATPSAPDGEGVPSDGSCAEHCASLAQAVPVQATSSAGSPVTSFALPLEAAVMALVPPGLWRPVVALRQHPPEQPPHSSVLRL
jgi:hypothetical protein